MSVNERSTFFYEIVDEREIMLQSPNMKKQIDVCTLKNNSFTVRLVDKLISGGLCCGDDAGI